MLPLTRPSSPSGIAAWRTLGVLLPARPPGVAPASTSPAVDLTDVSFLFEPDLALNHRYGAEEDWPTWYVSTAASSLSVGPGLSSPPA